MVAVKGRSDSSIGTLTNLGLTDSPIQISVEYKTLPIKVDAYGDVPPESQAMGMYAHVSMTLVHFDYEVLMACVREGQGSSPAIGQLGHAGSLMGNGLARFAPGGALGNHFIGLNIISAAGSQPWRFLNCMLAENPMQFPLGAERSLVQLKWTAFPYSVDPWNAGSGSYGVPLWDHTLDS